MAKERVLITVKTYPTLSKKYIELVCTAGFREDGSWIRIYPSPFRFLEGDQKYKKYQWIELDLMKNRADPRPESFTPTNIDDIVVGETMPTKNKWAERKRFILDQNIIYTNRAEIVTGAHANEFSLVIFKPTKILDFMVKKADKDWKVSRKQAAEAALKQGSLFEEVNTGDDFKLMPKLPYKFSYKFEDDTGKQSTLMIEDWEIGQLFWSCMKYCTEEVALQKVREKYWDDFAKTKDLHFFLGTTLQFHMKNAQNPYVIIGTFHPPIENQYSLF